MGQCMGRCMGGAWLHGCVWWGVGKVHVYTSLIGEGLGGDGEEVVGVASECEMEVYTWQNPIT